MQKNEVTSLSALSLAGLIKAKKIGVREAAEAFLSAAKNGRPRHNTFISVCEDGEVFQQADAVQKKLNAGEELSPLAGVPIALKDNICTVGLPATCASKMLKNFTPVYDATAVQRLKAAGLVVIGKLNMDEFAMGGSSETGVFGAVKNPWNTACVAGGSSGGSAAAVAAAEIPVALGSDTGGSIRQPCSFCGVSGIKPTYGAVSRYGLIAYASSLDQIGPIARDIDDCAALLHLISGADGRDATCTLEKPLAFNREIPQNLSGLKIGIPKNYFSDGIESDVQSAVLNAAKQFKAAKANVDEFIMPLTEYTVPAYYVIAAAEASSNLSRYDGIKYGFKSENAKTLREVYQMSRSEGFGEEVKRRIMLGSFVLSSGYYDAFYKKAMQTRALIKAEFAKLFDSYDIILAPVAPTTAYKIGQNIHDPIKMYMGDIYTVSVNLAGLPAVSLPCGFDKRAMPIGLQLIGKAFSEQKLITAAKYFQKITDWHTKKPGGEK
ncbi:MAG: Asp-tRNA(Asn)/Glu-tRNA(Gln) amidotransferase subunit GatA [Firmicutes bacterium]|nr:Asp-tRNA(Asn)/Glu-tRNA(Gln) amidotransferase subunit GatA [Bacillota bacterium]